MTLAPTAAEGMAARLSALGLPPVAPELEPHRSYVPRRPWAPVAITGPAAGARIHRARSGGA